MFESQDFLIKDLGPLTNYREEKHFIVADVVEVQVDEDRFSQIVLQKKYDGSVNYRQLQFLKQTLIHVI